MSGIVGCYRRRGGAAAETTREMAERISHRGPHGSDVRVDGAVGLGHQLLRATPEAGSDAFPRREQGLVVTGDVRLDNRSELIEELDVDADAGTVADGELLLEAYEQWGTDCPSRLLGAFAFAVWDDGEGRLFCARDHMGVKPFYYHVSDDVFAFGSEIKALLCLPAVSRRPNERRIGDHLLGRLDDERSTFYRDVDRLPPAHALTVGDDVRLERYWGLDPSRELRLASDEAYERRFRDLFSDAVRCRLRSEGAVGSFLSGGIDSSSVACVARDVLVASDDGPLHTYSAVFDDVPACDERQYVDAVLESRPGGFVPHFVAGDETSPLLDVERHLHHQDEPFYPSLSMLVWRLLREASRGVRVMLHGYGGDQTVGSDTRAYPCELARRGRFADLYAELRGIRERHPGTTYRGLLRNEVLKPLIPGVVRRLRHSRDDPERYVTNGIASIDLAFARRSGLVDRARMDAVSIPPRSQRQLQHRHLTSGEPTFNLELNDMAAAAVGIETRYPYFDKRLVEFCLAVPAERNVCGGLGRVLLRRALEGVVPPAVRWRDDKTEFSPNVVHTLRTYELSRVEETLFGDRLLAGAYLDEEGLRESFERFRAEGAAADARNLLMATVLELWLRRRAEQPTTVST